MIRVRSFLTFGAVSPSGNLGSGDRIGAWVLPVLAALSMLFVVLAAHALEPGEALPDPALEARARTLSQELRCMVCQNQSIDDSDAPLARDLRRLVRERLTAGASDGAVRDFLVARYGEFVLLRPTFSAHNLLLWTAPFAVLGCGVLLLLIRRRKADALGPLSGEEAERLRAELSRDP